MEDVTYVGLVGAAGSGKDSAADAVIEDDPTDAIKPYLAKPIKEVAMRYYDMSHDDCYTQEGKAKTHPHMTFDDGTPMTNRNVLEQIGDKLQELDPLVLMRSTEREIKRKEPDFALFPDLRTEPQAEYIRSKDGIIVYVKDEEAERKAEQAEGEDAHHTKTFYNRTEWDGKVVNDKDELSLSEFKHRAKITIFAAFEMRNKETEIIYE